jgi:transposase
MQAAIVQLNKDAGRSHGKIQRLLQMLFGIQLSRGGSVQATMRAARRCTPTYQAMVRALPGQKVITPDETGWRIGGQPAWLHVFVAYRFTCYVIDRLRGFEVAERILGVDYAGGLVHDGWGPYDRFWRAFHQQCLAHLLRRCVEMIAAATRGAVRFPRQVKQLLTDALDLRDRHQAGQVSDHGQAVARGRLEKRRTNCSPSCATPAWTPPTGGPSRPFDQPWSTARSGAAAARRPVLRPSPS